MISLPLKALVGAGVAGAIGAGGYGIYIASQKEETILDVLAKKNFTLLKTEGDSDNATWDQKVDEYKAKDQAKPTLDGYTEKTDGSDENDRKRINRDSMKKACKDLVQKSSKNESKLAQAEKWCTKNSTPA